jgi:hypothetical protein
MIAAVLAEPCHDIAGETGGLFSGFDCELIAVMAPVTLSAAGLERGNRTGILARADYG